MSEPTTPRTLDADPPDSPTLRERAERATPGPWAMGSALIGPDGERWFGVRQLPAGDVVAFTGRAADETHLTQTLADADFIAAAHPAAVLALYAELDATTAPTFPGLDEALAWAQSPPAGETYRITSELLAELIKARAALREAEADYDFTPGEAT